MRTKFGRTGHLDVSPGWLRNVRFRPEAVFHQPGPKLTKKTGKRGAVKSFLSELRRRVNRDDGKLFQVGNRPLGWVEIIGMLLFIGGMLLWQLHEKAGLSWIWAAASGVLGFILSILGGARRHGGPDL